MIRIRFALSALIFSLFLSLGLQAQEGQGVLNIKPLLPNPGAEVLNQWKKDIFQTDEVWVIRNRRAFFQMLSERGLSKTVLKSFMGRFQSTGQNWDPQYHGFYSFDTTTDDGYLVVRPEDKAKVSEDILKTVYHYLYLTDHDVHYISIYGEYDLPSYFKRLDMDIEALSHIQKNIVKIRGNFYFFYTPDIWPYLSDKLKNKFIDGKLNRDSRLGLSITLTYSKDDNLKAMAKKYAGERNVNVVESLLREKLRQSGGNSVSLPLQEILHPFIRDRVNTFNVCSGPNCFNAGPNVNKGEEYLMEHVRGQGLLKHVNKDYRLLYSNEESQVGDLLIYLDSDHYPIHVATTILDDVVFVKNGASQFAPYIFQEKIAGEKIYFPNDDYKLARFRIKPNCQTIMAEIIE